MTQQQTRDRFAPYLTVTLVVLMLAHTHVRLWGPLSPLQLVVAVLYAALVFPRHIMQIGLSVGVVLGLSVVQFGLFQAKLPSSEFPERVFTYPLLFCFLIVFVTLISDLFKQRWISHPWLRNATMAFLLISALQAGISLVMERIWLLSFFYNNPNEIAVACTAGLFYLAGTRAPPLHVYLGGACAIAVTFVGGARYSIVYALLILLVYSFAVLPKQGGGRGRAVRYGGYAAAAMAVVAVVATFATNTIFYIGAFDEFGVVPEALWLGWDAQTPPTTSIGFRINNVLAGLATLVQTGGLGIGIGRSAGLTEVISGFGGSLHVPLAEILVELGVYGCLALAWINLSADRMQGLRHVAFWLVAGFAGLAVQSSAYLTSYLAWFFIVAVCMYRWECAEGAEAEANRQQGGPVMSVGERR